jgi:hypothetical protein
LHAIAVETQPWPNFLRGRSQMIRQTVAPIEVFFKQQPSGMKIGSR